MDLDAATAGAHVAGRIGDLVADGLRIIDVVSRHSSLTVNHSIDVDSTDIVQLVIFVSLIKYIDDFETVMTAVRVVSTLCRTRPPFRKWRDGCPSLVVGLRLLSGN